MSARDIEGDRIVELVAAGHNNFHRLAEYLHILPHSPALRSALDRLIAEGRLREDEHGRLHTVGHDLLENLPAEGTNDLEDR
ncbi:hypothetical protein Ade02nite_20580 [Paractinoplanes deccanensis]|uniref:Uncharacterized protein n=1 Tax=Paractinoplanes deccanensis TaxID=113561 RepID=A0ABQ3Y0D4_9ACTN|nr:hypothetical protein [Actinoplanes deccanensis]GID73417.1 hypothetical protein Ade02nite_20580 [Actinoplanes deccanensis]